mmetsp:Transcript_20792/g.57841  ORF Transcript_20792/g.57841 Transcript_20792/m.57841 type:complete len:215 (-) Transcript_20792:119-763(-)
MTLPDLTRPEPIEVVSVHVGCEGEEAPRNILHFVRPHRRGQGAKARGLSAAHLLRHGRRLPQLRARQSHLEHALPDRGGHGRASEAPVSPSVHHLVALMRRGVAIVVEALAPEAPEELRLVVEPRRLADVVVPQAQVSIGLDARNIRIDRQATVCRKACPSAEQQHICIPDGSRRLLTGLPDLGPQLRPLRLRGLRGADHSPGAAAAAALARAS